MNGNSKTLHGKYVRKHVIVLPSLLLPRGKDFPTSVPDSQPGRAVRRENLYHGIIKGRRQIIMIGHLPLTTKRNK